MTLRQAEAKNEILAFPNKKYKMVPPPTLLGVKRYKMFLIPTYTLVNVVKLPSYIYNCQTVDVNWGTG